MNYPGQTGMGGGAKTKRYRIKDKAFNKLTDKAEKLRAEGKSYIVQDGDVMHFLHSN